MKKLFLLTIAVIFAFSMNAQRFGVRLGGNFAGMKSTVEMDGKKIAPGMQIGGLVELGADILALRVEANFSQKGYNQNTEYDDGTNLYEYKDKINFETIEVPVLIKVSPIGPLYLYAGPYFGIALKASVKSESFTNGVKNDYDEEPYNLFDEDNYNSYYKRTDFGVAGGIGAQFGIGPIHAFAEGRATLGLSNMYDTNSDAWQAALDAGTYTDGDNLKNMVWTVAVGIMFGK